MSWRNLQQRSLHIIHMFFLSLQPASPRLSGPVRTPGLRLARVPQHTQITSKTCIGSAARFACMPTSQSTGRRRSRYSYATVHAKGLTGNGALILGPFNDVFIRLLLIMQDFPAYDHGLSKVKEIRSWRTSLAYQELTWRC